VPILIKFDLPLFWGLN